ncbi:MAG: hypothetical protein KIT62_12245 [Cyclobacteriaceae bacterium]|nr:hypothetical protein [Cyclobacteriaceae bacterium]
MKAKTSTPKKAAKKTTARKSWADKMEQDHSVVKKLDKDFADMKAGSMMYISNPKTVDAYIRNIPKGRAVALKTMRQDLALEHRADVTCPVTTGIFLRIVAEAAHEQLRQGKAVSKITPFWRVMDAKMPLAKKLTFGKKLIREQRKKEKLDLA